MQNYSNRKKTFSTPLICHNSTLFCIFNHLFSSCVIQTLIYKIKVSQISNQCFLAGYHSLVRKKIIKYSLCSVYTYSECFLWFAFVIPVLKSLALEEVKNPWKLMDKCQICAVKIHVRKWPASPDWALLHTQSALHTQACT